MNGFCLRCQKICVTPLKEHYLTERGGKAGRTMATCMTGQAEANITYVIKAPIALEVLYHLVYCVVVKNGSTLYEQGCLDLLKSTSIYTVQHIYYIQCCLCHCI